MSASEKGYADVIDILIEAGATRNITKDKVLYIIITIAQWDTIERENFHEF